MIIDKICQHHKYYYHLYHLKMIVLFDIDALSIYMAGGLECFGILMMISIHNMFILSVRLFISAPIIKIIVVTFIEICFVVRLLVSLDCSFIFLYVLEINI